MKSGTEILPMLGDAIAQREAAILDLVRQGNFVVCWIPMQVSYGAFTATFMVSADSLRLGHMADSFRVPATAALYQKVADELGATLLTAKLLDDWYRQKFTLKLPYTALPGAGMSSMAAAKQASDIIDRKIAKAFFPNVDDATALTAVRPLVMAGCVPVTNEGKFWINSTYTSNQGPVHAWGQQPQPGTFASENYGFYVPGMTGTATGIPGVGVIQGPGHAHPYNHSDYSQQMRFVQRRVKVCKGIVCNDVDIYDLAKDPELAPLVNHDKVAINMRYPRVPWAPSTAAMALWGKPGTAGDAVAGFGGLELVGGWLTSFAKGDTSPVMSPVRNNEPSPLLAPDERAVLAIQQGQMPPQHPGAVSGAFGGPGIVAGVALTAVGVGLGWFGWQLAEQRA